MTKVKVELVDVYCQDTEDVTGADDFYLVGGLVGGAITKGILTTPIKINDKQKKFFKPGQTVLFEGEIPQGQSIKGGLKAYDEDAAKDWAKYGQTVQEITNAISGALAVVSPPEAVAETILSVATKGVGILNSINKDDLLGATELEISFTEPSHEERAWKMSKKQDSRSWSSWDYTLNYRIIRS
ncbi:hypothetical protein [Nostoc sp.]|uniref:hypothetical protein n=1 Tax=Nostoc sp. TaxID=1180 RepID=UPI002FF7C67D